MERSYSLFWSEIPLFRFASIGMKNVRIKHYSRVLNNWEPCLFPFLQYLLPLNEKTLFFEPIITSSMKDYNFYIYIISNSSRTSLYTGFTNNLKRRLLEHLNPKINIKSFCKKYSCNEVIYFEHYQYVNNAIAREKQVKRWNKKKKLTLIRMKNPNLLSYNLEILSSNN